MSFLKRLLIVIWVPPILAVSLLTILEAMPMFDHSASAPTSVREIMQTLPPLVLFGFGFCLFPSLASWTAMELVWKLRGSKSHRRRPSQLMGAIFGLLSGGVLRFFACNDFWSIQAAEYLLVGSICGLAVATLIYPRPVLETPSIMTAPLPDKKGFIHGRFFRRALFLVLGVSCSVAVLLGGVNLIERWEAYLPSEQHVRSQFADHRNDFEQFVAELKKVRETTLIKNGGRTYVYERFIGIIPKYGELLAKIGARRINVVGDGSIEFVLWGNRGVFATSYMGIRYEPSANDIHQRPGWVPTVVKSLDESRLPHENGKVATGLYVVPIETGWYVYREEYH